MTLVQISIKSILSRKLTLSLLILSIGLSSMLLLGIQKIKHSAKASFSYSISDTDLIVGARTGETQLLLYSVFRQGRAIANISRASIEEIQNFPEVKWLVPIALGDSLDGFPVIGTTETYFKHYKYGLKASLKFKEGHAFSSVYDVVLGSEVAKKLQLQLDDQVFLSHGISKGKLPVHKQHPFKVVGILRVTGTPVDRSVHIPLDGFHLLHQPKLMAGDEYSSPQSLTAAFIGLHSKFTIFNVQRQINSFANEAIMAIIPGVSLSRLWNSIQTIDRILILISCFVIVIAFIGLLLALFMSLQHRQRELALLRTMGAHPSQLFLLLIYESLFITISGVFTGIILMQTFGLLLSPFLQTKFGLILVLNTFNSTDLLLVLSVIFFGLIISIVPGILAYQKSLSEGVLSI
jgi:putative ABC transport system permease protein